MREKKLTYWDFDCGLDGSAFKRNFCKVSDCNTCGWGRKESERRKTYLEKYGLTECADGLRRLVIPKVDD